MLFLDIIIIMPYFLAYYNPLIHIYINTLLLQHFYPHQKFRYALNLFVQYTYCLQIIFRVKGHKNIVLGHIRCWVLRNVSCYHTVHIWQKGSFLRIPYVNPDRVCPVNAVLASLHMEGGAVMFCDLQDLRVFPARIQTPDAMPTAEHMKYLSVKSAQSGPKPQRRRTARQEQAKARCQPGRQCCSQTRHATMIAEGTVYRTVNSSNRIISPSSLSVLVPLALWSF